MRYRRRIALLPEHTVVSTSQNTYYPGTQAAVSAGATSITLGAIGSGANFGSTPIAVGDIVLIIQMQGAQILIPASTTNSFTEQMPPV